MGIVDQDRALDQVTPHTIRIRKVHPLLILDVRLNWWPASSDVDVSDKFPYPGNGSTLQVFAIWVQLAAVGIVAGIFIPRRQDFEAPAE